MIEYIYFVKCPNCEDEPFYFFDEAKAYAMDCKAQKPIITQVEVNRNDFGECTDSKDLGTIWSCEETTEDGVADNTPTTFSKADTVDYDSSFDNEFDSLDDSIDNIPDNFRNPNTDELEHSGNSYKPVPTDMSIDELVEAMEENEDTVECKQCNELFDKHGCTFEEGVGWLCDSCHTSRSTKLAESRSDREYVDLDYENLTIEFNGPKRDVDDWDTFEHTGNYTLSLPKDDVATTIWENFIDEEDVIDVDGGLEALEDDYAWSEFLKTHFDTLFEKYYDKILDYYEDDAIEAFTASYSSEYSEFGDDYYFESVEKQHTKSFEEELGDPEKFLVHFSSCPECGADKSFDHETGICINCGFII